MRSDTRLSQKHVSVEVINAKLFWNAFKCIVFRMKLRNAAPQWQSLPGEIDDKHNNSRKAFRNAFRIAIWLWVLKRVSKEENTARCDLIRVWDVSVEMINAKLFCAFTMCPRKKKKNRTLKQLWKKFVGCVTIIIYISWSMINMLSNDT